MTGRPPLLHDLVTCVRAPTTVLSGPDGQIRGTGAQGAFSSDVRTLSRAVLRLGGEEPEPVWCELTGPSGGRFVSISRGLGNPVHDPSVRVERRRAALGDGLRETLAVESTAAVAVDTTLELEVAVDLAPVVAVRMGESPSLLPLVVADGGAVCRGATGVTVRVAAPGAVFESAGDVVLLRWPVELPPRARTEVSWTLQVTDEHAVVDAPTAAVPWAVPDVAADDRRLALLIDRSGADLEALRLRMSDAPEQFVAAGSPWFFTLFGRDSLWAARLLLPLGTGLAAGTLTVLAHRQGVNHDGSAAEAPGKILHEVRRGSSDYGDDLVLPPVYYGSVDATALWVLLLHDAWRWGLPEEQVAGLLPHLERAMEWLTGPADADGDGFLEYLDVEGHGLANQGWKDSADSVRFGDGSIAAPPIALAEVQGYAYEAAVAAAALLAAFGRPGADRWLSWAAGLAAHFRRAFWVEDARGGYPAMALDDAKRRVDTLTSNAGHLLGTGLLDAGEAALVAARLAAPDMDGGFGLRTMSADAAAYSPLSYHCGSVWPHDTAIVALGLQREGHGAAAASLVMGLLAAATGFDNRLPELYAGDSAATAGHPVPYPAACRPQAWAAAAGVAALQVLLGLHADVPAGWLAVAPLAPSPVGTLHVSGLRVAGEPLAVAADRGGGVTRVEAPAGLAVRAGTTRA